MTHVAPVNAVNGESDQINDDLVAQGVRLAKQSRERIAARLEAEGDELTAWLYRHPIC